MVITIYRGSNKDKLWTIIRTKLINRLKYSVSRSSASQYTISFDEVIGSMRITAGQFGINELIELGISEDLKAMLGYSLDPLEPSYDRGGDDINDEVYNLSSWVVRGFVWSDTYEGRGYWENIYEALCDMDV